MKTTLNKIRDHAPCKDGWEKLLKHLGKTKADGEPLSLLTILDSNGLDYALWCLRAVDGYDKEMRLFAVWCARKVQHLMTGQRSLDALDVAEKYAHGQATHEELEAARAAAIYAAWDAARAPERSAASDSARHAASDSARNAAMAAKRDSAWDAAWAAATSAAWASVWAAARAEQETEFKRMLNAIEEQVE